MLTLETLPGWPEATELSTSFMLLLMIVGPLALGALVTLLCFAPKLAGKKSDQGELVTADSSGDTAS